MVLKLEDPPPALPIACTSVYPISAPRVLYPEKSRAWTELVFHVPFPRQGTPLEKEFFVFTGKLTYLSPHQQDNKLHFYFQNIKHSFPIGCDSFLPLSVYPREMKMYVHSKQLHSNVYSCYVPYLTPNQKQTHVSEGGNGYGRRNCGSQTKEGDSEIKRR